MRHIKRFLTTCLLSTTMLLPFKPEKAEAQTASKPKTAAASVKKQAENSKLPFATWLKNVRREAAAKGISQKVIDEALPYDLKPLVRIVELDRKQPEVTRTFDEYVDAIVSKKRTDTGLVRMESYKTVLSKVSAAYGVEPEVIVALWGIETNYGRNAGDFSVVQALATLAHDGRREEFFKKELFAALRILEEKHVTLASLKGSWAGAMGGPQFMPTSFFLFAQDFDRDGRRDIWNTPADIFASAANYLHQCGWKKGEKWGQRVTLPADFDRKLIGIDQTHSLQSLTAKGVKIGDMADLPEKVSLIQPGGPGTSAFVVGNNYKVVMKWNKSNAFATSVGLLSDKFKPSSP